MSSLICVYMSPFAGNVTGTFANVLAQAEPSHCQWGASNNSLSAILIAFIISILSIAFWSSSDDKIHKLEGFHLMTLSNFFSKRYDFFRENFKKTGLKTFRFNVLQVSSYTGVQFYSTTKLDFSLIQYRVIAMTGEANRKIFFGDRNLALSEGYRILLGGIPRLEDIDNDHHSDAPERIKRLLLLLRKERINEGALTVYVSPILILTFASVFPLLLKDVSRKMKDWGVKGKMNPFIEVYDVSLHHSIPQI